MIVSLDFSGAFDSVKQNAILSALKRFGFGDYFIKMIKTIMANGESIIKNGGWLSEPITLERGIRQGCCVSPLLFVIVAELLSNKIRQNPNIKGIQIDRNIPDVQYAEDLTLTLRRKQDLKEALSWIKSFEIYSGLTLNETKSKGMWVGSERNRIDHINYVSWLKPS